MDFVRSEWFLIDPNDDAVHFKLGIAAQFWKAEVSCG
jgi:hypothetical protein